MISSQEIRHAQQSAAPPTEAAPLSFATRTLVTIAERRSGIDAGRCRLALLHFETATLLHRSLHRTMERHRLTDLQFAVLVILFSTGPEPMAVSVLAEHAEVSRAVMTGALNRLETLRLARRATDRFDRRVSYVRITARGQATIDAAVNDYLRTAELAARHLEADAQRLLLSAYLQLLRGLTTRLDATPVRGTGNGRRPQRSARAAGNF